MSSVLSQLSYVEIEAFSGTLGWRFDDRLSVEMLESINSFATDDFRSLFMSPRRTVSVNRFEIATEMVRWQDVCQWDEDETFLIESLPEFCTKVEAVLSKYSLRLSTEDEFEVACGGDLFPWGNKVPPGTPDDTEFTGHNMPNQFGVKLNSNPYNCELVKDYLKLSDGGESIHGYYPWPIPWLSFCPAYRYLQAVLDECFFETLDETYIRPVKLAAR